MLTELVLKDGVGKLMEADPTFKLDLSLLGVLLLSAQLSHRLLATYDQVEVGAVRMASLIEPAREEIRTELVLFCLFLRLDKVLQLLNKHHRVPFVVHLTDKLLPCRLFQGSVSILLLEVVQHRVEVLLALEWVLFAVNRLQHLLEGVAHVDLDVAELFVAFVLQHFGEQADLVVLSCVRPHSIDDGGGPLNDERLESVLLHQVGVHKLLHRLHREA